MVGVVVPDDARCLASGSGLRVQVPGHGLLLHRAREDDPVHVPAKETPTGQKSHLREAVGPPPFLPRDSHGEVGDERSLGDLDVEADALGFGARVDHRAPNGGVGEARGDAALHLVALDGDVIAADGLCRMADGFTISNYLTLDLLVSRPD